MQDILRLSLQKFDQSMTLDFSSTTCHYLRIILKKFTDRRWQEGWMRADLMRQTRNEPQTRPQ
jgi:hypothetical protein